MKKLLSVLLTILMVLPMMAGILSPAASAEEVIDAYDKHSNYNGGLTIDAIEFNKTAEESYNEKATTYKYGAGIYRTDKKLTEAPHTFQAWVKVTSDSDKGTIVGNFRTGSDSASSSFSMEILEGKIPCIKYYDQFATLYEIKFENSKLSTSWTLLTIVWDGKNDSVSCYHNGSLKETKTIDSLPDIDYHALDYPIALGGDHRVMNYNYFTGALQNVSLFSTVRTAAQIRSDYSNGVHTLDEDLICHYLIRSTNKGTALADRTGNGYDLTYDKTWLTEDEMQIIREENGMTDYDYSFAVIGDIQKTTGYEAVLRNDRYGDTIYDNPTVDNSLTYKMYNWLATERDNKKINLVMGLGDITDYNFGREWDLAHKSIKQLDGKIPYTLIRGNHDDFTVEGSDNTTYFYFDYFFDNSNHTQYGSQFSNTTQEYRDADGNLLVTSQGGGRYASNSVRNTYLKLTTATGEKWMVIALDWGCDDDVIAWARELCADNSDYSVIITTHAYLNDNGNTLDKGDLVESPNTGDDKWNELVSQYSNIKMVLSGHVGSDMIVSSQTQGVHGNTVTQMLIDGQNADEMISGIGLVTMFYFKGDKCFVEHYSVAEDMYFHSANQFSLNLNGSKAKGINSIEKTNTQGLVDTYTVTFADGTTTTFTVTNGAQGEQGIQGIQGEKGEDGHTPVITIQNGRWYIDGVDTGFSAEGVKGDTGAQGPQGEQGPQGDTGNGIASIEKTSTEGLVDTYTITFTDGTTTTFTVTNGAQGIQGIQGEPGKDGHTPVITIQNGYWYIDGVNTNASIGEGVKGDPGNGISSIDKTSTEGLVDTYTITFTDGTTTTFTVTNGAQGIQGIQGEKGEDGHTPVITIQNGYWYIDGVNTNASIGEGVKGDPGNGISSIDKTSTEGLVDTYTITFTDGTTTTFTVTNGAQGEQGIQGIQGVPGKDGHTPVITIQDGKWYIDGVDTGVVAAGTKGDTGNGISSIEKTATEGLVDTYTITFTDGTTTTFTVTNGAQGIQGIKGEKGEDGHTPVITIENGKWYIDGVDTGVVAAGTKGDTGNGISSIEKTATEGLVDTYTITFTDGTTTTFTVTNGAQGEQGIQGIQGEKGEDGHTPIITIQDGKWYIDGVDTGVVAEGIKGDTGNGISSIEKTSTEGLVDTYTITFTDGTTTTFTVTNGAQGIQGIQGEKGEDGHTPVITIQNGKWYIDGVNTGKSAIGVKGDKGDKGDAGNGISSIIKSSSNGLVDTYTIIYTDGTTSTFTVTNGGKGEQGEQGIQGEKGDKGEQGDKGDKGQAGQNGANGADGSKWYTGTTDPEASAKYKKGDMYLNSATYDLFTYDGAAWVSLGSIKGAPGENAPAATTSANEGCRSVISGAAVIVTAVVALGAGLILRKKED